MLSQDVRNGKITPRDLGHIIQRTKENKHLFGNPPYFRDMWNECCDAIKIRMKGVFLLDGRCHPNSTHTLIFESNHGEVVGIPCFVHEDSRQITPLTITDVRADKNNPNWFVRGYNEIARERDMKELSHTFKHS